MMIIYFTPGCEKKVGSFGRMVFCRSYLIETSRCNGEKLRRTHRLFNATVFFVCNLGLNNKSFCWNHPIWICFLGMLRSCLILRILKIHQANKIDIFDGFIIATHRFDDWKEVILAILCDLFGMVKWPLRRLSDLQLGGKKVTLNHLDDIFSSNPSP